VRSFANELSELSDVPPRFLLAAVMVLTLVTTAIPAGAEMPGEGGEWQLAGPSPEYLEYVEDAPEVSYGYVPSPLDLSHVDRLAAPEVEAPALPDRFDWRDQGKVSSVKDQRPCGMCWAFAATAVLESAVLLEENASPKPDFSEQSLGMCVDRSWFSMYDEADEPCNAGGGWPVASEVFIRKGAVSETCSPYDTSALNCDGSCVCDSCPAVKTVNGVRVVAYDGSQIDRIKNAVYNEGPVTVGYQHESAYLYEDPTWGTIYDYYPNPESANHLVSIVGWDDDVPHPNPSHGGTGAWLAKNSWGTGFGNDGYFYLAYDSGNAGAVTYFEYKDSDSEEELLYWDETGWVNQGGFGDETAWFASVFTAPTDKALTHVEFWATSSNAAYEITVWDGEFGSQLAHKTGSCQEAGYYSIPLNTPISVPTGEWFTVGVKMTTPGYNHPIPIEHKWPGDTDPPIQSDVSFVRHTAADSWQDLADQGANVCLRARMGDVENAPPDEPSDPSPVDGATEVSTSVDLSWTGGDPDPGDTVTYDVYLEAGSNPPGVLVCDDVEETACDPGTLDANTHYYWYVEATDSHDATTSDVWDFTTVTGSGASTWDGSVSSDWHTAENWTPSGVPTSSDEVTVPDVPNDPVISTDDAAVGDLTVNGGAVLDLTDRTLTVEGTLTNDGTLRQTRGVAEGSSTSFLRITNLAGTETKYYGVDVTPSSIVGSVRRPEPAVRRARDVRRNPELRQDPDTADSRQVLRERIQSAPEVAEHPAGQAGDQVLYSIADADVLKGYPSEKSGSYVEMWAGYDESLDPHGEVARSLVKFDIASLPSGQEITDAKLVLYLVRSWDYPDTSRTITAYRAASAWSEDSVTWSNKPGFGGAYGSQSIVHGAWGWYEFDVTDLVAAWHDGTYANHGIMLRGPEVSGFDSSWRAFGTRESDYVPKLIVDYSASNTPPNAPGDPSPADGTTGQGLNVDLYWTGGDPDGDDVTYDVYFEADDTTPDELLCDDTDTASCDPGSLEANTHYYWYVEATDEHDASTTGSTWDFSTEEAANQPPILSDLPDQEVPINGSRDNAIDLWAHADDLEDADDQLTFSISNVPAAGAGVSIDGYRYIDINPDPGWTGGTEVEIQVEDTGGLTDTASFRVSVVGTRVTVSLSGNQSCAGRETGVQRCYNVEPEAEMDATARFYFTEGERNAMALEDLVVFHDVGDWIAEPGPYTRGGTGDAQYVEAQNVDDFSRFALDRAAGSNRPPQEPHDPTPSDGATDQLVDIDLSWTGGDPDAGDTVTYDVYLEAGSSPPGVLVCDDVGETSCDPGTLDANTHYYWYVEATDSHDATATGDAWEFTTGEEPECSILFDASHDSEGSDTIDEGYADFANEARAMGYGMDELRTGPLTPGALSGYCGLVLADPEIPFTEDEVSAIRDFVEAGGGLLVLGEGGGQPGNSNCNPILGPFGIRLDQDYIYDDTDNHDGKNRWPLIRGFADHDVTEGVDDLWYLSGASLHVRAPVRRLGWGDDDSYTRGGHRLESSWATVTPTIDGHISAGEWGEATRVDLRTSAEASVVMMYLKNDGGKLYLAFDDPNDTTFSAGNYDQVGIYFDDEPAGARDGAWTYDACPSGEGQLFVGEFTPDPSTGFQGIASGPELCDPVGAAAGVNGEASAASGHVQYEVAIDLAASELRGSPGDWIGMDFYVYDYDAESWNGSWTYDAVWENPSTYGEVRLAAPNDLGRPVAIAASPYGSGRVVAVADSDMLSSGDSDEDGTADIHQYDAERLAKNVAEWICQCGEAPNTPPDAPSDPSPAGGATDVSIDVDLSWSGGDADLSDTVTYDVYCEAENSAPDELICNDVPTPACDPGTLDPGRHYYWYVVATDSHGASTESEIWHFTTAGPANEPPSISGLPDQDVPMNGSADDAIDLWAYADDAEDDDDALSFAVSSAPAEAGVSIDGNHYLDINPAAGWTGTTEVEIQVEDTAGLTDVDSLQLTVTGGTVYLPLVVRRYPPLPGVPVLNAISNPEGDGDYTVSWGDAYLADEYVLQEDDNQGFFSPAERYSGPGLSWDASGKVPGTYYYRVKAINWWRGRQLDSGWSRTRSVTVRPPGVHYEGDSPWVSFDVVGQQVCDFEMEVPFEDGTCYVDLPDCLDIVDGEFSYTAIDPWLKSYENSITGRFEGQNRVEGDYTLYFCENTLYFEPSEGDWDASKQ